MIKVDENDPVGELQPSFPYRDVSVKRNMDMKEFYELESEIGRGKFGTVYRCMEKSTGIRLAAKFVGIARRQDRRNVEREVDIMRTLQHPRLIQLYDAFEFSNVMCVIQELIEGGELFERVIDDDFILTEKACTVFMRQICEGVEFIHSQNILHLDLKPENILCLTRTGNRIKIIDFGLARKFEPDKKLQVLFGTPEFVAPEVVNFEQIGFGTDMWSVGVICYVLLSGLSPFMGETDVETMANVTIAQYDFDDDAFDDISVDAKDFITKLLMKNKEQRLSATECLSHIWLRRKPTIVQRHLPSQVIQQRPIPSKEILDNTKENLRDFIDRYSEINTSPTKIISVPINEPLKPVNDNKQSIDDLNNKNNIVNTKMLPETQQQLVNNIVIDDKTIVNQKPDEQASKKLKLETNIIDSGLTNSIKTLPDSNQNLTKPTLPTEAIQSVVQNTTNVNTDIVSDSFIAPSALSGTIPKTPSKPLDKPNNYNNNSSNNGSTIQIQQQNSIDEINSGIKSSNENQSCKLVNAASDSNIIVNRNSFNKPPVVPTATFYNKPKLIPQLSVPNNLSKIPLNKNIPVSNLDNRNKASDNVSINPASSMNVKNEPTGMSDSFKLNKTLNKHVPPKIHGIVLGQTNESEELTAAQATPKVITHKIFVEGRSESVLPSPGNASTSSVTFNKDARKFEPTRTQKPITKSQTLTKLELNENKPKCINKNKAFGFLEQDRFDRRGSDISCFLHNSENMERLNLADEIKKLSQRLFQMGGNHKTIAAQEMDQEDEEVNDFLDCRLPVSSFRNDPIGRFLANHGVVTRRPKFRMSYMNRDVPIGSPPPASNLFYHLSHSNSDNWSDNQTHSAPQSPSISPDREQPTSLTKEVILRLFDKSNNPSSSSFRRSDAADHTGISSIDSLASYFKTNSESKKNTPTPFLASK